MSSKTPVAAPPIVAISTPPGTGAIAMIRISGPGAIDLGEKVFRSARPLRESPPRQAVFGRIVAPDGSVLDEVLLTRFVAPASYTGEDMLEISCHGGVLVTASILGLLLQSGGRAAGPGEFTLRAFMNGKLDLTQAEAVMDLIQAKTPLAMRAAAEQLEGRIGTEISTIREQLLEVVAHLEAWIDFPEEGIDPATGAALIEKINAVSAGVGRLLATADEGRILREGVLLAICGRPNAGKSSLLNRLLGFERAIVSEQPGTTRDTIEEIASLRGVPFRIIDTAGLRHAQDLVERAGIERARRAIEKADVVLEVIDATGGHGKEIDTGGRPHVIAWNKCDIANRAAGAVSGCEAAISCTTGDGLDALVEILARAAGHHAIEGTDSPAAINARHQSCLQRAQPCLRAAVDGLQQELAPELVAIELRAALESIGEVIGQADTEEILGKIFSSFCIGK